MQLHSGEMDAVVRKRNADKLVLDCIAYIKRHDAALFATMKIVNLTILKLLGVSGPVKSGVMRKALLGPEEEGSKPAFELVDLRDQYEDAYVSFHTVSHASHYMLIYKLMYRVGIQGT